MPGILLLSAVGTVVYNVRFAGNILSLLAGISLGTLAFFALGYAIAGLAPSTQTVVIVGNVVLYVLMIFSGSVVPMEVMPQSVQAVSGFLPLTHLVSLLRGLWFGIGWESLVTEVAVLAGLLIVGTYGVGRTFRWE